MTCRGYDPKAVKLSKSIQRLGATIRNENERNNFIKLFVDILKTELKPSGGFQKKTTK